ncbi:MAG TPA: acyl-CoA dehydrogenase family protein [Ilumatobacteraceae bacterium]
MPAVPEPSLRPDEIIARAIALRQHLRDHQAKTEARSRYSEETHELFTKAGFFRILQPRKFGGYEFDTETFYRTIIEISRGCPSTGWMLCLGAGHALQVGSSFSEEAQAEIFGPDGHFVAPLSVGNFPGTRPARPVDGGYRLSGKWRYASGVPYSTHFMGLADLEGVDPPDGLLLVTVPRDSYEVLDDWGDLIGLKGSGSNSVVIDDAFIPAHHTAPVARLLGEWPMTTDLLPGAVIHGNPMYTGGFMGFAISELTSVQVGAARAMLDEYEQILASTANVSMSGNSAVKRYEVADYQRSYGMALGWVDAAHATMVRSGQLYMELAATAVKTGRQVSAEDHWRLYGMVQTAARLSWEAGDLLFRTAGSSASLDGQRMQRYWRDLSAFRSNSIHQFDFRSRAVSQAHFGLPVDRL